jgi:peptide deformylase
MAKRTIVTTPNPILNTKAEAITEITEEIITIAQDLKDTLASAKEPEGAGIAANQIGIPKRICIVRNFLYTARVAKGYMTEDFILINPKIIYKSPELESDWEGCLSVPDKYGRVPRYKKIKVEAQTLEGNLIQMSAKDLFARVIQHEIDHLDGVLFTSKIVGNTITEAELDRMLDNGEA